MKKIIFIVGLVAWLGVLFNGGCSHNSAQEQQSEKIECVIKDLN